MKKKIIIFSIIITVCLCTYWGIKKFRTQASAMPGDVVWVQAENAKEFSLPVEAQAIGTITARAVDITSEIPGHVAKIAFQDGALVKAGDLLIQLDDAVYQAKYNSALAQLVYSQNNYKRMMLLGKKGAISKQAIDQADADLKEKQANAQEMQVMLSKSKLAAPFDGVVSKRRVNDGDYVNVAQPLVSLTDTHHLHVEYNVPEKYLPLLKIGQAVQVKSNTYPNKIFKAKVAYISPTINADSRSISIYAEVPNEEGLLASGMLVDVAQALGKEKKVVMISARALVPILDGAQVYKVVDNKAYPVTAITGKRIGDKIQVLQGIVAGDKVITDGQLKLRNGAAVNIKNENIKT